MSAPRSVVIVGGGIAGVSTAAALRARGFEGDVTLVDAGEVPYDRPPLSKEYLAGHRDLAEVALQQPDWYDDQAVRLLTRARVTALRAGQGAVELADGSALPADRVVLATGGGAARPPVLGWDDDRVHVLRTVEDADRLRSAVVPGTRVLVVGGGLIGAEASSTLVGLGVDVTLAEPLSPPLADVVGHDIAEWLHGVHAERGIATVHAAVDGLLPASGGIRADLGTAGDLEVDVVLLAVGMQPDTSLAGSAGLDVERGVVVDAGQVTSNPSVLAVGDAARHRIDRALLPLAEHWEAAEHDGARAAATILGVEPPAPTAPWFWTDRHGLHVEVVGRMAGAGRVVLRGVLGSPPFAAFGLRGDRVVAAVAVDDSRAVRAARRMVDRGVAVDADALADPGTDLRRLLRG